MSVSNAARSRASSLMTLVSLVFVASISEPPMALLLTLSLPRGVGISRSLKASPSEQYTTIGSRSLPAPVDEMFIMRSLHMIFRKRPSQCAETDVEISVTYEETNRKIANK